MTVVLHIALFGALGCLARYFLSGWVYDLIGRTLPYGTLAVNVIGAFLIGLVMEFSLRSAAVSPELRIGLTIVVISRSLAATSCSIGVNRKKFSRLTSVISMSFSLASRFSNSKAV